MFRVQGQGLGLLRLKSISSKFKPTRLLVWFGGLSLTFHLDPCRDGWVVRARESPRGTELGPSLFPSCSVSLAGLRPAWPAAFGPCWGLLIGAVSEPRALCRRQSCPQCDEDSVPRQLLSRTSGRIAKEDGESGGIPGSVPGAMGTLFRYLPKNVRFVLAYPKLCSLCPNPQTP